MPVTDSYSDSIEQREDNRRRFLNTKYSNKRPLQKVKGSKVRGRILGRHTVQSQDHKNSTKLSHRSFCGGDQKQCMVRGAQNTHLPMELPHWPAMYHIVRSDSVHALVFTVFLTTPAQEKKGKR